MRSATTKPESTRSVRCRSHSCGVSAAHLAFLQLTKDVVCTRVLYQSRARLKVESRLSFAGWPGDGTLSMAQSWYGGNEPLCLDRVALRPPPIRCCRRPPSLSFPFPLLTCHRTRAPRARRSSQNKIESALPRVTLRSFKEDVQDQSPPVLCLWPQEAHGC